MLERFQKKPPQIEAVLYTGDNAAEVIDFVRARDVALPLFAHGVTPDDKVTFLIGGALLSPGLYVVRTEPSSGYISIASRGELLDGYEPIVEESEAVEIASAPDPPAAASPPFVGSCGYCGGTVAESAIRLKGGPIVFYYHCLDCGVGRYYGNRQDREAASNG